MARAVSGCSQPAGSHSVMRDDMRCYYVLYASRYAQAALSVLLEHKRKDFVEMQVHHSVTVALVGISYAYGWNRIGVIVMLLLDPAISTVMRPDRSG